MTTTIKAGYIHVRTADHFWSGYINPVNDGFFELVNEVGDSEILRVESIETRTGALVRQMNGFELPVTIGFATGRIDAWIRL